ncbi:uncharacterized protein LOC143847932 [Tasmannia lanceolata]|uniref:uncharacterized protein LOC143847932 n=1 Tax=Tasmannia lanceolata TaxID=3420 RepID=UPI0040628106
MGLYKEFLIGDSKVEVSLLQFADDTLLLCSPVISQLLNLKAMLRCYEMVSGQRSNFGKSRLYAINVSESDASSFARIMGCGLDVFPATYLGLPLGVGRPRHNLWAPIIQRIERRLATWKRRLVSKGGRLVLIKAILSNMPIYFLSLFHCPASVAKRIEQIQRRFL